MTTDFIPSNAYLIKGKGIEQVKSEIKEWFQKYDMNLVYDKDNILAGYTPFNYYGFELWIRVKLIEKSNDTFLIFDPNFTKTNNTLLNMFQFHLKPLLEELRRDLVRYISGKKEMKIKSILYLKYIQNYLFLGIFFFLLFPYFRPFKARPMPCNHYPEFIVLILIALSIIIDVIIVLCIKTISLNDKYYIEEYKGEIEID